MEASRPSLVYLRGVGGALYELITNSKSHKVHAKCSINASFQLVNSVT